MASAPSRPPFLSPPSTARAPPPAASAARPPPAGRLLHPPQPPHQGEGQSDVDKLFSGFSKTRENLSVVDELLTYWNLADTDRVLDDLEEDFGPKISFLIVDTLLDEISDGKLKSGTEIKASLKRCILELLTSKGSKTELQLGQLAHRFKNEGAKAAARDQLEIWAERTGSRLLLITIRRLRLHQRGKREGFDIVLCDTSGRLHTNYGLMEELVSCKKVIAKALPGAPNEILLVLDGTTGLNMLQHAKEFNDVIATLLF
ncbi:hypothetical protein ZWY2020_011391 [Hordeum vulgare]|nr:hypothetical protein ZWY2020_011391 [Hordeum vulgare]